MEKETVLRKHKVISTPRAKRSPRSETIAVYLLPEEIAVTAAILARYRKDILRPLALRFDSEDYMTAERYFDTAEDVLSALRQKEPPQDTIS